MNSGVRLGLGTVQWGMAYGIANRTGQPSSAEISAMLRLASEDGIRIVDTAYAYGDSENLLGEQIAAFGDFQTITKTKPIQSKQITEQEISSVISAFLTSLEHLQCRQVYGLLVHDADALLLSGGKKLWKALQGFKAQGKVRKIGVSVYHPQQLEGILESYPIELVQLPFNIYDQRFSKRDLLHRLKQAGVEVHARSAFLQGLLLLSPENLPAYFSSIRDNHVKLHQHFHDLGVNPVEGCLYFCLEQPDIDYVIVGCESAGQLRGILHAVKKMNKPLLGLESFAIKNEAITNPSVWPR